MDTACLLPLFRRTFSSSADAHHPSLRFKYHESMGGTTSLLSQDTILSSVETVVDAASAKVADGAKVALLALTHSDIAENYLDPVIHFVQLKYRDSPLHVRLGMWSCATVAVLPVACSTSVLLLATIGCVIVVGNVLLATEVLYAL